MRYHYYTNNKNIVVATSTYAGKVVRGVAKCSPNDEFNLETGKKIAKARLDVKVAAKRKARARLMAFEAMNLAEQARDYLERMSKYFDDSCDSYNDALDKFMKILNETNNG